MDLGVYIGVTENLSRRVEEHNRGYSKATKPRRPLELIYHEKYNKKEEAYKREFYLKSPKGYKEKLRIIKDING